MKATKFLLLLLEMSLCNASFFDAKQHQRLLARSSLKMHERVNSSARQLGYGSASLHIRCN